MSTINKEGFAAGVDRCYTIDDLLNMDPNDIDTDFWRNASMTPRSSETFRRAGILPSEIIFPTHQSVISSESKQLMPEVVEIRLKAAKDLRDNFMQQLQRDYAKIKALAVQGQFWPEEGFNGGPPLHHMKSTVVENDRAQLRLIQIKQEREVEKMLEAEFIRKEIEQRNAEKAEQEYQKQLRI